MTTIIDTPTEGVRSYPGDYCLKVRGAYGACILWPDHDSPFCQDANGFSFMGVAITKRVGANPFVPPAVDVASLVDEFNHGHYEFAEAAPLVDMPRVEGEFDSRLDNLFAHQPTKGNPWASLARWGIRMGRIRRMVMDLHTQDGAK